MNMSQSFRMAFMSILSNKMRSFLTMLGIIIGVFAVTMLVSLGQGTTSQVTNQIQSLGSNMITASISSPKPVYISLGDLKNLQGKGGIGIVAPLVSRQKVVKNGTKTMSTSIEGSSPGYDTIRSLSVNTGRFITQTDLDIRSAVAVIGTDVADQLYGTRNVTGSSIDIDGRSFKIVGVLASKGSSMMGSNDNRVIIPVTTAQRMLRQTQINEFFVSATAPNSVDKAENAVNDFLYEKVKDTDYYSVFNQSDLLSTLSSITGTLTIMLGGLAGISLLVGGIGIMNIMLVSVTERTREIGIRKAIGAQRGNILIQFLIESMVISLTGGLVGLLLGGIGIKIIAHFMGVAMSVTPSVAALAIIFSVSVGVVFGLYPANKASKMRPIDALRYE